MLPTDPVAVYVDVVPPMPILVLHVSDAAGLFSPPVVVAAFVLRMTRPKASFVEFDLFGMEPCLPSRTGTSL